MPDENQEHLHWQERRDKRIQALSELSRTDEGTGKDDPRRPAINPTPSAMPASLAPSRHSPSARWRLLLFAGLILVVIAGGAVGVFVRLHNTSSNPGEQTLRAQTISVRDVLGLRCISQPAWSPDGRDIALLGTTQPGDCVPYLTPEVNQTSSTPPQTLAILDARSGHVVRSLALDPLLGNKPNCNAPGLCGPDTARFDDFYGLSWSPDSQSVAIAYANQFVASLGSGPIFSLLVVRADGGASFRIADTASPLITPMQPDLRIWNLPERRVQTFPAPDLSPFTVPFATAYTWDANGHLTPQPASENSAVGNPTGGQAFTPWQSGSVDAATEYTRQSGLVTYQTWFWAWAPDGTHVATFIYAGVQVLASGLAQPTVNTQQAPAHLAALPVRDAALAGIVRAVASSGTTYDIAWRPDGADLAALHCVSDTTGQLAILRTSDGRTIATTTLGFPPSAASSGCTQDAMPLAWSPDGSVLMTSDAAHDTITLWRVPRG